ncbi:MAG: ATP-dependent zinc metalloprotease FtsH [Minisyncoccia bacterium]
MKNISKNFISVFLILLTLVTIFSLFFNLNLENNPKKVSLNIIASDINSGKVKEIKVNGNDLTVTLDDGSKLISQKEPETGIIETLKNYGVDQKNLQNVNLVIENQSGWQYWASILIPTLLPLILIGLFFWWTFKQARSGVNQAFSFGKANIKIFNPNNKEKVTFKDVAGLKEAKEELQEVVEFLKNPQKFLSIGAKIPRGVLLVGQPGTGKTLLARAVANEAGVAFFHMSASEFVEMFVGVGASRVRDLFQTAKKVGRSIIFIDEIDAVGRERGAGIGGGHDEREQTLNQILVEMDGFERDDKRIVIAATNRPDILDPALLRPGRFDRRIVLDLPDINDREEILKIHCQNKPLAKDVNLRQVAIRTPGFSGADLANLVNEAAILAARKNQSEIYQQNLLESIEKVMLGPERKSRVISQEEKERTAYHEAGHALVAVSLQGADPVQKVSIISRGLAGGYTLKLPLEDRHLKTKSQFLADLAMLFGGYVSEEIVFKDVSTGASNDLEQATHLARDLVMRYGMSDLGPRTFGKTEELVFLGKEISTEKDYSEKLGAKIDAEINKLIDRSINLARKIIVSKKQVLEKIAKTLIEKETIEQEEFYNLIKPFNIKPIAVK